MCALTSCWEKIVAHNLFKKDVSLKCTENWTYPCVNVFRINNWVCQCIGFKSHSLSAGSLINEHNKIRHHWNISSTQPVLCLSFRQEPSTQQRGVPDNHWACPHKTTSICRKEQDPCGILYRGKCVWNLNTKFMSLKEKKKKKRPTNCSCPERYEFRKTNEFCHIVPRNPESQNTECASFVSPLSSLCLWDTLEQSLLNTKDLSD